MSKYRVYECPGIPGSSGFHVSIRQDSLDEFVTNAVLAHAAESGFMAPHSHKEGAGGPECLALRAMIKSHRAWLKTVHKDAARLNRPNLPGRMEQIVLPKIKSALKRIEELEGRDSVILELSRSRSPGDYWRGLELFEQRRIVRKLVIPRIRPVDASQRGRRGLNASRIELTWRH